MRRGAEGGELEDGKKQRYGRWVATAVVFADRDWADGQKRDKRVEAVKD